MKELKDYLHLYLGCKVLMVDFNRNYTKGKQYPLSYQLLHDSCKNNGCEILKPILHRLEEITDPHIEEIWICIGGAPHLFNIGKPTLMKGLIDGDWDESGLQLDYYTLSVMINNLRNMGYDMDDLIDSGLAIDSATLTPPLQTLKDKR